MAKISTYPEQQPPSLDDYVIGTSVSNALATKNYFISDVLGLVTLDMVLTNGNTSLLDANIGSLGLWDSAHSNYITIGTTDQGVTFNVPSVGQIFSVQNDNITFGNAIIENNLLSTIRTYNLPNQSGTFALTSDLTLNNVLNTGNTSLLDAKIGELYLYDITNFDYAKIKINDSEYNLYDSGGTIITTIASSGIAFHPNAYNGFLYVPNTITTSRIYEFPNQSGVVALVSDIPFGKIKMEDPTGAFFTNLTTAHAYVDSFTASVLYDETFHDGVYRFSVAPNASFALLPNFCDNGSMLFEDPDGLVVTFGESCFVRSSRNNIFGNITVGGYFLSISSGDNTIGTVLDITGGFLENSTGNNIIKGGTFLDDFLAFSNGNNIVGNIVVRHNAFKGSRGNNKVGSITADDNLFYASEGSNTIDDISAGELAFHGSLGNNTIRDIISLSTDGFSSSSGNNTIRDILSGGDTLFGGAMGNNTMNVISVGLNCFQNANPTIKNTVYQILNCSNYFASNYTGRMDVGLWGIDGTLNLPTDIFTTNNITWIHTFWSNQYNNVGGQDADITNVVANFDGSGNATLIFD
jgi:hypothetical protein